MNGQKDTVSHDAVWHTAYSAFIVFAQVVTMTPANREFVEKVLRNEAAGHSGTRYHYQASLV